MYVQPKMLHLVLQGGGLNQGPNLPVWCAVCWLLQLGRVSPLTSPTTLASPLPAPWSPHRVPCDSWGKTSEAQVPVM